MQRRSPHKVRVVNTIFICFDEKYRTIQIVISTTKLFEIQLIKMIFSIEIELKVVRKSNKSNLYRGLGAHQAETNSSPTIKPLVMVDWLLCSSMQSYIYDNKRTYSAAI